MPSLPVFPDTHIHIIPPSFRRAVAEHPESMAGWTMPEYSQTLLKSFLASLNITHPILSVTAPGTSVLGPTPAGRRLTRQVNEEVAEDVDELREEGIHAGFFATLPDFNDVEGVLEEISWIFGVQKKASGVTVLTNYGNKTVANPTFRPIWDKLNAFKALVFMHPTMNTSILPMGVLPEPVLGFPHATTTAAIDLLLTGTMRACPDIDVILSHAGGTLPFVGPRAFSTFGMPAIQKNMQVSEKEALEDAKRFYYDLAGACTAVQLTALLMHTDASKITFGTDFPYGPTDLVYAGAVRYAEFVKSSEVGRSIRPEILFANAKRLVETHYFATNSVPVRSRIGEGLEDNASWSESARKTRVVLETLGN